MSIRTMSERAGAPLGLAALALLCGVGGGQARRGRTEAVWRSPSDPRASRAGARGEAAGARAFGRWRGDRGAGLAGGRLDHADHLSQAPDLRRGDRRGLADAAARRPAGLSRPQLNLRKEQTMQTRQLGCNSDLEITPIGFGAWAIGGGGWAFGWGAGRRDSIAAIHGAWTRRELDRHRRRLRPGPLRGGRRPGSTAGRAAPMSSPSAGWTGTSGTIGKSLKADSIRGSARRACGA